MSGHKLQNERESTINKLVARTTTTFKKYIETSYFDLNWWWEQKNTLLKLCDCKWKTTSFLSYSSKFFIICKRKGWRRKNDDNTTSLLQKFENYG